VACFAAGVHCSARRGKGEHCGTRLARQAVPHFVDGSAQLYRLIGTILIDNYGILGPMMRRRDVPMVTNIGWPLGYCKCQLHFILGLLGSPLKILAIIGSNV
jgi:hypothetical protein